MTSRAGKPIAKIVPIPIQEPRRFGIDVDIFKVPGDFDDPLPDDVLDSFVADSFRH